ncbi:tyrosine-type recombinase/integrase [Pelagibacterium halotolerans]|nr:site-specific integrase [Pelagibacterium halotolerans]QJR19127.1 site-specific integrase [Pelagibacterium halotolerans]SEA01644.1 Site-specific recombinase XerD [Pelagibacterium halotolerans]
MAVKTRKWTTAKGEEREAYVVRYTDQNGKRHLKTFDKKKDAKAFDSKTHVEVMGRIHVADSETVTIEQAGKYWLESCAEADLEASTLAQYEQHLRLHIVPAIGRHRLNEVTVPFVRAFTDKLAKDGKSKPMVRAVRVSLGALLSNAQELGLVVQNSVKEMGRTRNKAAKRVEARKEKDVEVGVEIPTLDEILAIIEAASGKARVFLMTAAFTGMRSSELRGLRWPDLDFESKTVAIRQRADAQLKIGSPKSKKGKRAIPLPSRLCDSLKAWQKECPTGKLDLVFPNGAGNVEYYANITKRWYYPAQLAAGVTVETDEKDKNGQPIMVPKYSGLHALRHFYASFCINPKSRRGLELPPKVVQARMGHASIQLTLDTYGHLFPSTDDSAELDDALDAIF